MRKPLLHTKVTVKLRKSIFREEWYLYIESYPVYNPGSTKPKRIIEAVNRTITTPIWDMTAISKIDEDGKRAKKLISHKHIRLYPLKTVQQKEK